MSFRGEGTGPPNGIMDRVQDPPSWPASWAPGPTKNQDRPGSRRLVWDGLRALGQAGGSRPLVRDERYGTREATDLLVLVEFTVVVHALGQAGGSRPLVPQLELRCSNKTVAVASRVPYLQHARRLETPVRDARLSQRGCRCASGRLGHRPVQVSGYPGGVRRAVQPGRPCPWSVWKRQPLLQAECLTTHYLSLLSDSVDTQ